MNPPFLILKYYIFLIINATSLLSQLKTHKLCIMSKSIKISVRNCIIAHALKIIPQFNNFTSKQAPNMPAALPFHPYMTVLSL